MFDYTSADSGAPSLHRTFITRAPRPWDMFFSVMTRRKTRAALSSLDDHLLKDIGISRGEIDRIAGAGLSEGRARHRLSTLKPKI